METVVPWFVAYAMVGAVVMFLRYAIGGKDGTLEEVAGVVAIWPFVVALFLLRSIRRAIVTVWQED